MQSPEGTISGDRQGRPALATGLPSHRLPLRQASPRSRNVLWSRTSRQLRWWALIAIAGVVVFVVAAALVYVISGTQADTGQPVASTEATVADDAPATELSTAVPTEPAAVTPVAVAAPVNTPVAPTRVVAPAIQPTVPAPAATRTPVPATPTTRPEPTSTPAIAASVVWVGNTGGSGVYVRRTPSSTDRLRAYGDGTQLTVIGEDVSGDGQQWKHVRAPDGLEGYVPATYVLGAAP